MYIQIHVQISTHTDVYVQPPCNYIEPFGSLSFEWTELLPWMEDASRETQGSGVWVGDGYVFLDSGVVKS